MSVSLAAVVYAIYSLKQHGLNPRMAAAIGVAGPVSTPTRIDLCESRVQHLKTASGVELFENGFNWFIKKGSVQKKLDPVAVEKWFGRNCAVYAENLRPNALKESEAAEPVLIFGFVHGATEILRETAAGEFIWRQFSFRSDQLDKALRQLPELREADPHGRANPTDD